MRRLLLIALVAALAPCANAQRMVSASPRFASGFHRGAHSRSFLYPLAFSDPFYSDYLSNTGYPVASQPPVIVMQSPPVAAPVPDRVSTPSQPLMIELQGDRYVRVSGPGISGAEMIEPDAIDRIPNSPRHAERHVATADPELVPAILIFRDGHREEVSEYTIADGSLYTRADYYTNGSWNRKIELSSLNLSETIRSNQSRGVRFQLPSFPNEVIVRP